jgi:chemotaxis protein MotB
LRPFLWVAFCPSLFACGYSQDEWDQKVRENEELRSELREEKRDREKADADYADALDEIDALRAQLSERGVSLDSMSANLEAQKKALEEYQRRTAQLVEIQKRFDALRKKLEKLTRMGLTVVVRDNRMVIQLPGDVLFDSGSDKLREEGQEILLQIAQVIQGDEELSSREFQVAGHTDARALSGGMFRDNWGLSAMRARSVLVLLTTPTEEGGGGLDPTHWSAAGYGATDPVADNDTEEGRARNRRVELVVQPDVKEMISLESIAKGRATEGRGE